MVFTIIKDKILSKRTWLSISANVSTSFKSVLSGFYQLLAYTLILSHLTFAQYVYAAPKGGTVIGGTGAINQTGLTTNINQLSSSMAIDWNSYNLNSDEVVNYYQPDASSISLNRILGSNASQIHGQINANGQVVLVNPNGVFFGKNASINVGGLIASGLDIDPVDFMNGDYIFNQVIGTDGTVINSGLINASLGGNVTLLGKQVMNEGVISAKLGSVNLAAGKAAVLTFDQQGLLGVQITEAILQDELGIDPAVLNSGEINAAGGRVLLTASVSQDVFSQAVNSDGIEQATSVVVHEDGSFTLGDGADVVNTGSINVSTTGNGQNAGQIAVLGENVTSSGVIRADAEYGRVGEIELHAQDTLRLTGKSITSMQSKSGGNGGLIWILGDKVGLFDQSIVNVSGADGGGEAYIGGGQQGLNSGISNAEFLYLGENTLVSADALDNGTGGKIIAFATDTSQFYGGLSARGGVHGGDGGFVETSGLKGFQINKTPDVSTDIGSAGEWLIDPNNIDIISGSGNSNINSIDPFVTSDDGAQLGVDLITDALTDGASVTITTGTKGANLKVGNITFLADLFYDGTGDNTLTLNAANDINTNKNNIKDSNTGRGTDSLNLVFNADSDNSGVGSLVIDDSDIETNGGTFSASGVNFTSIRGAAGNSISTNGGSVSLDFTGTIDINSEILTSGGNFTVLNSASFNNDDSNGAIDTTGGASPGNVVINSSGTATLGELIVKGDLTLTADGGITEGVNAIVDVGNNAIFTASGNNIWLDGSANDFQGDISFSSASNVVLVASNSINLGASVITGALDVTVNGGGSNITQSGAVVVSGTSILSASGDDITLNHAGNNFSNVTLDGDIVTITDTDNIVLNASTITDTLNVTALNAGDITQSGVVSVTGAASFTADANDITLNNALNEFASVSVVGGNVILADVNDIDLGSSTITGILDVTASGGGNITQSAGLSVDGAASFLVVGGHSIILGDSGNNFAGSISFAANAGNLLNVSVANNGALDLGNITVSQNLSVDANGAVTDSGVLSVGSVMGINANGNSVTLDSIASDFKDLVIVDASSAKIVDANGLNIGSTDGSSSFANTSSNMFGNLYITTLAGNITDENTTALIVGGVAELNVGSSDVVLDSGSNNFASVNVVQAQFVTLVDTNSIDIRSGDIAGDLNLIAGSSITNNNGGLSVTGNSVFTAGTSSSITIDHASNSFLGDLTFVASSGNLANISVTNTLAVNVPTLIVSNNLTITSGGGITQTGALTVGNSTTLSAAGQDIILPDVNNLGELAISTANNATINNGSNSLSLNGVITDNSLSLSAGSISDGNGDALNIRSPNLTLGAANGIGNGEELEIQTSTLNLINSSSGKVQLAQSGDIDLIALENNGSDGDITFASDGDINFSPGSTVASLGNGDLVMTTSTGSFLGLGVADINNPDITAQNATFIGRSGTFGDYSRRLTLNVPGSVFIDTRGTFDPQFVPPGPSSLVSEGINFTVLGAINAIAGEQLVEIESLSEINPAIFTALRNYNQEEIAIKMPRDQLYEEE